MKTSIDNSTVEYIMKEALKEEVKKHLIDMLDNHLEKIARDSVERFLLFSISQERSPMTLSDNIYFSFVNNITKTVVKEVVVQDMAIKGDKPK